MKIFILLLLFILPTSGSVAYAEDEISTEETINEFLKEIDFTDYSNFLEEIEKTYNITITENITESLQKITAGEMSFDMNFFIVFIQNIIKIDLSTYIRTIVLLLSICILSSILQNFSPSLAETSTQKVVSLVCYCAVITIILTMIAPMISTLSDTLRLIQSFSEIVFPPIFTIMLSLGNIGGLYQPFLAFLDAVLPILLQYLPPLIYVCISLHVIGNINSEIPLQKLSKTILSTGEWTLGLIFGTFITLTTAQGITGSSISSLWINNAKTSLGTSVPIVGNYLKDGFDIVLSSCLVIKNALGEFSIILLLIITFRPIVQVVLCSLTLKLCASINEPFGNKRISSVLFDITRCLRPVMATYICVFFSFFVLLMLLIMTFTI